MNATSFTDLGRQLNFKGGPNSYFGLHQGFMVNMIHGGRSEDKDSKVLFVQTNPMPENTRAAVEAGLGARTAELGFETVTTTEDTVTVVYDKKVRKPTPGLVQEGLEAVVAELRSHQVTSDFANLREGDYGHYVIDGIGVVLETDEAKRLRRELDNAREQRGFDDNGYGVGAAAAFGAGLIGAAAWVAVAYYLNYITAIGAFAIAFLSYWGYMKADGKLGPLTKPILVGVNLLLILVAQFYTYAVEAWNYNVTSGMVLEAILQDSEIRSEFLMSLLLPLVFMGIAIFAFVKDIDVKGVSIEDATPI